MKRRMPQKGRLSGLLNISVCAAAGMAATAENKDMASRKRFIIGFINLCIRITELQPTYCRCLFLFADAGVNYSALSLFLIYIRCA